MGKAAAIIRRGQRRDPRLIPAPTLVSMLRLHGDLFFGRLQARIVAEGLGLWQRLKRRSIIQRLAAYMLRKSVKFSAVRGPDPLGAPGSLSSWHVSASLR